MTRRMLSHRIRSRFRAGQGARVLGVGYAIPYLEPWRAEAERVFAFMPARQGVVHWPQSGLNDAALVEEADLPLPDASVDLVWSNLALHWHPQPDRVFAEWRRVLRVEGLLMFSNFGPDTLRELRRYGEWRELDDVIDGGPTAASSARPEPDKRDRRP